jgi:hypothetical protein
MLKKILAGLLIAFIIYYIATNPDGAAHVVSGALSWFKTGAHSLSQFFSHLRL